MTLAGEVRSEAEAIFEWWRTRLPDDSDGFHGEIAADGRVVADAPRSVILYTRLLWFFSAAADYLKSDEALSLARRAMGYIRAHFVDADNGGLYWLLDADGQVIDGKKQAYAQAFGVYALAEYFNVSGDIDALGLARRLQAEIEHRFWDGEAGGYIEALGAGWRPLAQQRLSDKDIEAPKTMNTHLHVLEAYSRLHEVAPDAHSRAGLDRALGIFVDRFAGTDGHLRLFYSMDWSDRTQAVSYGHDIEASWLMWEAARVLDDAAMTGRVRPMVLVLAETARTEGVMADGTIAYERSFDGHLDPDGEWWGQAEGLIGFVNAWQLTRGQLWLDAAERLWNVTKAKFGAGKGAEWTWYANDADKSPQALAGQWKCPYHNGRAMIELDRRLNRVGN